MISLTNKQIAEVITVEQCIPVVEKLFKNIKNTQMPPKVYMNIPNGDFRSMPAVVGDTAGIKWCGLNIREEGKIHIFAKILINDTISGDLLAIMDGELITAIRTAAVTGVATKYMAPEGSRVAAFVGCGVQTPNQIKAVCAVSDVERVNVFDLDRERMLGICRDMQDYKVEIHPCIGLEECVGNADIVTTLTPARGDGYLEHCMLKDTCHVNAVGADAKGKREVRQSVLEGVDLIVYDEWEQCSHSGEIQYGSNTTMVPLATVVAGNGEHEGRQTLFDATGLAIEDVATARYIYDKIRNNIMCG